MQLRATLTGHTNAVYSVAVTPNGQQVVSGSDDNTVKVSWEMFVCSAIFKQIVHLHFVCFFIFEVI